MKKVYVFLANGFEEIEGLTVVDLLRRVDIETVMVSIEKTREVVSAHQISIIADKLFEECDFSDGSMIVLPGGMPGTNNLLNYSPLIKLIMDYNKQNKYIGAICAAPIILGLNGVLEGKKVTSYPTQKDKLIGAHYTSNSVEVDGNIITSKGMGTSIDFALSIITILVNQEESNRIKYSIQYA